MGKQKAFLSLIIFLLVPSLLSAQVVVGGTNLSQNPNLAFSLPINSDEVSEILVSRPQYLLSWNKDTRIINWAMWTLSTKNFGSTQRQKSFQPDAELSSYLKTLGLEAVQANDLRGSCFDRGHQVPSADRTSSQPDNYATFNMSNVVPQTAFLNRFVWEHLESYTRQVARSNHNTLLVIAGVIFDHKSGGVGPRGDIAVPTHNFKIVVPLDKVKNAKDVLNSPDVIAVIMPNVTSKGTDPMQDHETLCDDSAKESDLHINETDFSLNDDWKQFQVPVNEIQTKSGFEFFY